MVATHTSVHGPEQPITKHAHMAECCKHDVG